MCRLDGQPEVRGQTGAPRGVAPACLSPAPAGDASLQLLFTPAAVQKAPRLIPPARAAAPGSGFPLLHFQPKREFKPLSLPVGRTPEVPLRPQAPPKEAWGLSDSCQPPVSQRTVPLTLPPPPDSSLYHAEAMKNSEAVPTGIPTRVSLDQYAGRGCSAPQQGSSVFIRPPETALQNSFGLPLLHLQFKPPYVVSTPARALSRFPSVPGTEGRAHPQLSLLHPCLPPENTVMTFCV